MQQIIEKTFFKNEFGSKIFLVRFKMKGSNCIFKKFIVELTSGQTQESFDLKVVKDLAYENYYLINEPACGSF